MAFTGMDEKGYVLGLVMVFFIIFSLMGLAFVKMGSHESIQAFNDYQRTRAFYYAEAGIHEGVWRVNHISNAAGTFSNSTVSVVFDSVSMVLTATGTAGSFQDSVRAIVQRASSNVNCSVLFVVVDTSGLSTEESNIKTLLESWGHDVNTIDEDDSQATFDTAVAANDVVYISEDVNSGDLSTKLRDAAIGIVNEEPNLVDEFRIAGSHGYPAWTTAVTILDNSHYITSPFNTGSLTIFSSSMPVANITNNAAEQAPDLQILGQFSASEPTLVTLEKDSLLYAPVIMVVDDKNSPSSDASSRKAQLETWGYAVVLMESEDPKSAFDQAATTSLLFYILEEVSSSEASGKFRDQPIGVVYEEDNLDDDLKLAEEDGDDFSASAIDITDNSHYITSPFSTGSLTVLTTSEDMAYLSGTKASGRQTLAEKLSSSNEVLVVVEAGATLYGGGSAAARRVRMPWHNVDLDDLTNDGKTLLKRSIEWAAEPRPRAAERRVELPWGGNDMDINALNDDGKTLMKRAIEWAARSTGSGPSGTVTIWTWEDL